MNASQINSLINHLRDEEKAVLQENARLKELIEAQNACIQKQREELMKVSNLAKELISYEKQRNEIINKMSELKTNLIERIPNEKMVNDKVENILAKSPNAKISESRAGAETLKIIEDVQNRISALIMECTKADDLSVPKNDLNNLIIEINDVIQANVKSGQIGELKEDTFCRQSFVISALAGSTEK